MDPFHRLPGHTRTPPGLEHRLWRRLPAVLAWGTLLPVGVALLRRLAAAWSAHPPSDSALALGEYALVGVVVLHWTLVFTVAVGCWVVRIMKGPAFVADPYPPPGRNGNDNGNGG